MYALAIVPAIILFIVVWKFDKAEKEPAGLLARLFICGACTVISAVLMGLLGDLMLRGFDQGIKHLIIIFIDSFIITGLVQEAGKFLVLKKLTWKNREFNYTFDGVVYAAAVSLGFTVCENIVYILRSNGDAAAFRVILSVPAHVFYAVFMGYFYSRARCAEGFKDPENVKKNLALAVLIPTFMNGFYAFCLRTDKTVFFILFVIYEIIITVITVRQFIRISKEDTLIPGMEWTISSDDTTWEGGSDEG